MLYVIAALLACILTHIVVRDFSADMQRERAAIVKKHLTPKPKTAAQREADRERDQAYLQRVGAGR